MPGSSQGVPPHAELVAEQFVTLCNVIAQLRSPQGCPWDREQTMKSIKPYTLEETYELLEAIDSDDNAAIQEELGDVLLQVVLDSQIAADEERFTIIDVIEGITRKMISRHPHVFGDAVAKTASEVRAHWEQAKNKEKNSRESIFDGIPKDLPALARAARITKKAASVGYDFPLREMLFDKFREEVTEFLNELYPTGQYPQVPAAVDLEPVPDAPVTDPAVLDRMEDELGDILFVVANICRRWGVNPEEALRRSNAKFAARFQFIEQGLAAQGRTPAQATLLEMEELYQQRKQQEKQAAAPAKSSAQP